ncbi:hypothetical protein LCGC14_0488550 [marine sediment metagenome]|uniref:Uncharacterized protein n=1 Tax=marine sediment metagenome TaxID=412755 RepID=A0A0F9VFZ1_9ZZZZ
MIKEIIQVISTEQKVGKGDKPYLEVVYTDKDGKERKKNIFDSALWNLFSNGFWVELSLEKEGNWWNVKSAVGVEKAIAEKEQAEKPKEIAPQELGMWWKELGNRIGDSSLERDYPKAHVKIKVQYYKKLSEVTGVSFKEE